MDKYKIKVIEGDFGDDQVIFRVTVIDEEGQVREFNVEPIKPGFGATEKEAIDDFIRRNNSDVLDVVFNL